jgi:hypothetical protein
LIERLYSQNIKEPWEVNLQAEAITLQPTVEECGWYSALGSGSMEVDFVRREAIPSAARTRFVVIREESCAE